MSAQEHITRLVNEVLEKDRGRMGTHYEVCYLYHAPCLASYIKFLLEKGDEDGPRSAEGSH